MHFDGAVVIDKTCLGHSARYVYIIMSARRRAQGGAGLCCMWGDYSVFNVTYCRRWWTFAAGRRRQCEGTFVCTVYNDMERRVQLS